MNQIERDLGWIDHWVLVHNHTQLLNSHAQEYGVSVEYFVGFVYVDMEAGISLDVASYCTVDANRIILTHGPRDTHSRMILRYPHFSEPATMELTILSDAECAALNLPHEPEWLHIYKEGQERVEPLRNLEILHPIRAPGYPDDIQFILPIHRAKSRH